MGARKPLDLEFLQRGPGIRAGRVKVLVAFGDITGFGAWTRRGSHSPEKFKDFMVHLYKEFIRFRNGNGYFVKLMGDRFMCITEIGKGNAKAKTSEFLNHAVDLESAVQRILNSIFPALDHSEFGSQPASSGKWSPAGRDKYWRRLTIWDTRSIWRRGFWRLTANQRFCAMRAYGRF